MASATKSLRLNGLSSSSNSLGIKFSMIFNTREDSLKKFQNQYLCNLLGQGMLIYLIWKRWMYPFICCTVAQYISRGCRVRGQNVELHSKTPGGRQNMIIKYLSVGQGSWFSNQQVALNVLFNMRYESIPYSKKQPSDRQRGWDTSCFHPLKHCLLCCTLTFTWGLHASLLILVCHSVMPWGRSCHHTSYERGDNLI